MTATTPWGKRPPYPYDMRISGYGVMLEPQADGNLVSQKSKTLDATAPVDYTYSSANPYKERSFEWHELFGGFGQSVAPTSGEKPRRYSYAQKCDLSVDGLWIKGPKFETDAGPTPCHQHVQTISAPAPGEDNEVRQFVWALHDGQVTLFALCQNGVYRRTGDDATGGWTVSLSAATLGVGVYPQQALRFMARHAGAVDALYVTTNTSYLWQYDGTTWTMATEFEGPGDADLTGEARFIERINDELWVAGEHWVMRTTSGDPMLRASWSGAIWIGDQSSPITWLKQLGDQLFIFKQDGVYSVDTDALDHELFPTLRDTHDFSGIFANGRNATVWINRMWFSYNGQTFILDESALLKPDGMEQMLENTSPVEGRWIAGAGHNTWFMYELLFNPQRNTSYLIKHGTWVEENATQQTPGVAQFAEAHHGALYDWNKRGTCLEIVSNIHPGGNDRLYVGFSDGTICWTALPRVNPNPTEDSQCEYTSLESYVYLPVHHSSFRADNKLYHGVTVAGPRLSPTEWVEVEYRLDIVNTNAEWTLVAPEQPMYTLPSQRFSFTEDEVADPVYAKNIQFRIKLVKDPDTGRSAPSLSPITEGIIVHESIRPAFSREFTMSIKAGSFLARRDGLVSRRRGSDILKHLVEQSARIGPVNVVMPTGETEAITLIDYRDSAAAWATRRDHEYLVQIQGIQLGFLTGETGETVARVTYATLKQYTLGQLETII